MKIRQDKVDILWSKLVRERDGCCRKCGKQAPYKLDAHHIRPRSRSNTRYDLSNGLSLCVHHHRFGEDAVHNVSNQKEWLVKIIGLKEFNRLDKKSLEYNSRDKARKEFLTKYKL